MGDHHSVIREEVIAKILDERKRQDEKFGEMPRYRSASLWLTILVEEVGEIARAILEEDSEGFEIELIQVAAVAFAALEDLKFEKASKT